MPGTLTRRTALAAAAAALVAVPAGGWYVASAATAADVAVETRLAWCRDTPLERRRGLDDDRPGAPVEVLVVTPRTRCGVDVRVRNDGTFPVHLDRAVAPLLGPAGGAVLQARVKVGGQPPDSDGRDDGDASSPLDRTLPAGRSTGFRIVLEFRADGCTAGSTTVEEWPVVTFSSLGRDARATGPTDLVFRWRGPQNPGCTAL
ncbi:hypothetical protein [Nocardioides sp. CFH 31398]|uniref:hypothetical protein n=1 Tax=Nocardioides sp. CFH 31398 TaxID=2919579 RepID=UPI001F058F9B|nr:hypothetical protein [Nocardioides sp. CFH 31398]MCH1867596.1 hypothetical protein [Nocardioides sp. CFH 31398]